MIATIAFPMGRHTILPFLVQAINLQKHIMQCTACLPYLVGVRNALNGNAGLQNAQSSLQNTEEVIKSPSPAKESQGSINRSANGAALQKKLPEFKSFLAITKHQNHAVVGQL
ncbi:hypothetical protein IV203_011522 [Nitzschia inconspicua]|uniref:Uncharacterized protein n=1 Tax=Nitzschia inconspicua TaxID=303405 RepID=A0A9K3PIY4_9STRA|nr:hypothetical protein IV203_011522 [Nitzschia inconspicua]